jgi:hypothetical protein
MIKDDDGVVTVSLYEEAMAEANSSAEEQSKS